MLLRHLRLLDEPATAANVRERELEVGRLVLRAADTRDDFVVRRAASAVAGLETGPGRRALRRAVEGLVDGDGEGRRAGLLGWGAVLERHGAHADAAVVYRALMRDAPGDAVVTLHAARAARRSGAREEALALYRRAAAECGGDGHMVLLARIGEALVSADPVRALSIAAAEARRQGDGDALAVAREERARTMAGTGHGAAVRDLAVAAVRYRDRTDRVRVLHALADLLAARGDLPAAREALLAALHQSPGSRRGNTVQRLRAVARAMGDELELRRSRGGGTGELVMLAPRLAAPPPAGSLAPRLRRLLSRA